jgi:N-acetylglutamate synthase-like GNAT family acetyltransferase
MVNIRNGLKPGDLGYITYLHGKIYHEEYGFDTSFEPYVARPLSDFSLSDNPRQNIWIAELDNEVVGCVAIVDADDNMAQLRWLLLKKEVRGRGLGKEMMQLAVNFCKKQGFESVFLWTVDALHEAAGLYDKFGFDITDEVEHLIWGKMLKEQRYELKLTRENGY